LVAKGGVGDGEETLAPAALPSVIDGVACEEENISVWGEVPGGTGEGT
jgi:hypothetical protein